MKGKIVFMLAIVIQIGFLAGCVVERPLRDVYYKFYDSYDDYVLARKDGDLYVEKLNRTDSRRVTFNPKETKTDAMFTKNGRCIVYSVNRCCIEPKIAYYMQPVDKDDSARTEIAAKEFFEVTRK
ncbi:MAG: hypothetical protein WC546_05780 [Candidatus Omnitrophota bacterium]